MCPITETEVAAARRRVLFPAAAGKHVIPHARAGRAHAQQLNSRTPRMPVTAENHTLTCKYYYIYRPYDASYQESYIPLQSGDHGDHFKLSVFKIAS